MHRCRGRGGPERGRLRFLTPQGAIRAGTPLAPHLMEHVGPPVGEQADAVGGGEQLVEMVGAGLEREIDEHVLGDVEGRLDVQGHSRHDAEAAESDDRRGTVVRVAIDAA